ncbi:MAG TPA: ABC transporter permease [Methylocella sp.]|nr:ABC transporter permease [Methylocella sp.]
MRKIGHYFFVSSHGLTRLVPLISLLILWQLTSRLGVSSTLPTPTAVLSVMVGEARSGALFTNLAITFYRVAAAFTLAMVLGSLLGVAMGLSKKIDRFCDPLLIVLLNVPALVIIVLAYIWIGLNERAAIGAVALNKLPNTAVILREGARTLDKELDEMAFVFRLAFVQRLRHVLLPQLMPYVAAAMRSGLSLVWKIVLVVELLGRSNGVGFEIGVAFQLFDVTRLFAYAFPFVLIMLAVETFLMQPFERHISRWRRPHGA